MAYRNNRTGRLEMTVTIPVPSEEFQHSLNMLARSLGKNVGQMFLDAVNDRYQQKLTDIQSFQRQMKP